VRAETGDDRPAPSVGLCDGLCYGPQCFHRQNIG